MRILVVCQHYWPEPFNVSEICEELVARGHSVTVLTGLPNYPDGKVYEGFKKGHKREESVRGVRVVRVPIVARGRDLKSFNKIRRMANYISFPLASWFTQACADEPCDCVLCVQYSPVLMALPALRIARRQKVPCLVYSFDLWPEDMLSGGMSRTGAPYKAMRRVSRRIYGSADLVAVTSPGFASYFAHELGLEDLCCECLPQYAEGAFEALKGCFPTRSDGEVIFTFAGNVGANQSVETIVRASSLVDPARAIRVRIAGVGSRLEECESLARELGAPCEFLGRLPLEDMPALYADSDAMLLTLAQPENGSLVSLYTIPRKLQSYLAASKPVVAAADGTASDIVKGEGCGIACPAGDAAALAKAMARFAQMGS